MAFDPEGAGGPLHSLKNNLTKKKGWKFFYVFCLIEFDLIGRARAKTKKKIVVVARHSGLFLSPGGTGSATLLDFALAAPDPCGSSTAGVSAVDTVLATDLGVVAREPGFPGRVVRTRIP
jgi:hypothetical protein